MCRVVIGCFSHTNTVYEILIPLTQGEELGCSIQIRNLTAKLSNVKHQIAL